MLSGSSSTWLKSRWTWMSSARASMLAMSLFLASGALTIRSWCASKWAVKYPWLRMPKPKTLWSRPMLSIRLAAPKKVLRYLFIDNDGQSSECLPLAYQYFWAGWSDADNEGTFVNANTGEVMTEDMFSDWGLGEPNGKTMENCATIRTMGYWNDHACFSSTCGFCEFDEPPIYIMRGNPRLSTTLTEPMNLWLFVLRSVPWLWVWCPFWMDGRDDQRWHWKVQL